MYRSAASTNWIPWVTIFRPRFGLSKPNSEKICEKYQQRDSNPWYIFLSAYPKHPEIFDTRSMASRLVHLHILIIKILLKLSLFGLSPSRGRFGPSPSWPQVSGSTVEIQKWCLQVSRSTVKMQRWCLQLSGSTVKMQRWCLQVRGSTVKMQR